MSSAKRVPVWIPVALALLAVGMVIAAAVGGVNWLIGVGGGGTALGTLGLAAFTSTLAQRTTELADSSLRLEAAANSELNAANEQARAAIEAAREAQRTRIDAVAPLVDLEVAFVEAKGIPRGMVNPQIVTLSMDHTNQIDVRSLSFDAFLRLTFTNYGRTPAFVQVLHSGAAFNEQHELIRLDSGDPLTTRQSFMARADFSSATDEPFEPREIIYIIEVRGAMSGGAVDTIRWGGKLTLLKWSPPGWRLNERPLIPTGYEVERRYGDEPRVRTSA